MSSPDLFTSPLYNGFMSDFARPAGRDLMARTEPFFAWQEGRRHAGLWPYSAGLNGPPAAECAVRAEAGAEGAGLNFMSQDYLSLATHPAVLRAAHRALRDHGPHSAGSPMLGGYGAPARALEAMIGEALEAPHVALFSTGWGASYATVTALVRPDDHVVLDTLAHASLQAGAAAATRNVVRFRHLDAESARRQLQKIRARDAENGILVVTEGLFSMDSDVPDLLALQAVCHEWGATLLVDAAHDFGQMGPRGTGSVGVQGLLGKVDLVTGAFSKTFASNGGFLATRSPAVRQYVRMYGGPHVFSNALSPVQACVVAECLRITRSAEGDVLRGRLRAAVDALRGELAVGGAPALGEPSAVVPVPVGDAPVARVASRLLFERGVFVNLAEYPAVPVKGTRFRVQVMAGHTPEQARRAGAAIAQAIAEARTMVHGRADPCADDGGGFGDDAAKVGVAA
jgi:glycine C-acetyltransferase